MFRYPYLFRKLNSLKHRFKNIYFYVFVLVILTIDILSIITILACALQGLISIF